MLDPSALRAAFPELNSLEFLAESGQKYVFRAQKDGRSVVLKIVRADQDQERIDREIHAVAKLSCNYVPVILESGQRPVGDKTWTFLVEEFVEGESYRAVLQRQPVQPLGDVLRLATALLSACCDFEVQQMVHRDIKPENLLIGPNGKIWIIDFGIVRLLQLTSATLTQQRFGLFTPGYGAPEQVRNLKPKIDARADLFSVGIVLYEALHGSNPYLSGKGNVLEIVQDLCNRDLPRLTIPGDIGGKLSEFVASLCARFPSRRPPNAREALQWFREIVGGLGTM
ncbi:MAG: serine/threonine protein kinase [bacterium]|nr:serine/threonine protein kinase [bacterium]